MGVGNVGVLFYFSISESGEYEAGLQEEDDECLSCNIDTTVIKPPFRGLVYWPDGDARYVAMQETHSSNLNLGFSCPRSQKKWRNTVDCAFKSKEGNAYVTTITIFAEKCEHSSLRTSLAPFCNDATVSLDHVQRGEKVLYLGTAEANNRRTRQGLKSCVNKRKTHTSITLTLQRICYTVCWRKNVWMATPRMKTTISISITSHEGSIQNVPNQLYVLNLLFPWPGIGRHIIQWTPWLPKWLWTWVC